jgi:hypothetical protein
MYTRRIPILLACLLVAARANAQTSAIPVAKRLGTPVLVARPADFRSIRVWVLGLTSAWVDFAPYSGDPPAAKYRIYRNSTLIDEMTAADVGSGGSYVDNALRDNTPYSYYVEAIGAPETINGIPEANTGGGTEPSFTIQNPLLDTSNTVTVTTRALAPPGGISASIDPVTPNTVDLSWPNAPTAQNYLLLRNGVAIGRFNSPATDTVPAPGRYTYSVESVYPEPGGDGFSSPSPSVTLRVGPFNIVALGDSIMWGQGLLPADKFTTLTANWVMGQMGKSVQLLSFAHSGAVLGPSGAAQTEAANVSTPGEVPDSYPTIDYQGMTLAPAQIDPGLVDLILLDGCINDVSVGNILSPAVADADITSWTDQACSTGMSALLSRLTSKYPHAKIALTSYYPIASDQSNLSTLMGLAGAAGVSAATITAALAPLIGVPPDPLSAAIAAAIAAAIVAQSYPPFAIGRSTLFDMRSRTDLSAAMASLNGLSTGMPVGVFVPVPFAAVNSYAAPQSWLWDVPAPPFDIDEVYGQRTGDCTGPLTPNAVGGPMCLEASAGHPNVMGAMAYSDAVTTAIAGFLPEWQVEHATSRTAP